VGRELLDKYAYAALSGPDGLQRCEVPLSGYILMAPQLEYADHRHAPRELYLVLTPGAQWSLDGGDWFEVEAGDLIVHEPWQMHAMRTADQPMLAFAAWLERGDRLAIEI
jgi:gentisate 1,2-dioxygenase